MKTTEKILAVFFVVLALAASTSATIITVEVEGVVDYVATDGGLALDGSAIIGSAMTGRCTYDTDTPDHDGRGWRGLYEIDAISMTIGNYTFTHDLNSDSPILFSIGTIDYNYVVKTLSPRFDGTVTINGLSKTWDDINWSSSALTLLDVCSSSNELNLPDTLPESVPDISIFNWRREFYVRFVADNGSSFHIYGEITSLTVVPAPFEVTPANVDFHYYIGEANPEPQTLSIWAKEVDTLNWQITGDCNWLDVSPTTGQSSGEVDEVTLSVDISGLAPGSYHCQLTIFDPNVPSYILHLPVNLFIGTKLFVPSQYLTIQAAIDAARDFDMVLVADGNYTGPGNRDIDFLGKAITVKSESGPENCIIDCNGTETDPHYGFYLDFHNNESIYNAVVEGFTITNGYASEGGGIKCGEGSLTITNCVISGNTAGHIGGGIWCSRESNPTITNCTISGNSAERDGGGIWCSWTSSPTITNCTISGNTADRFGGAVSFWDGSNTTITNCTISGNSAENGGAISCIGGSEGRSSPVITNCTITGNSSYDDGGGIYCGYSSPTILNCTFAENSAFNGTALACDFWYPYPSDVQLTNCILADGGNEIWNNDDSNIAITYSNIQGGWPGIGNIDADPYFVEPGYLDANNTPDDVNDDFWVDGDYHLLRTSPCIDAASDANVYTDIEGNVRPFDFPGVDNNSELPEFDMGAYEATAQEARLLLLPRVLNCKSRQPRVMALVRLPQGITKDQIDSDTALILYPGGIKAMRQFVIQNRRHEAQRVSIFAFFNKAELMDAIDDNGRVQLQILGHLRQPGQYFYATDTIKIKPRR